MSKPPTPSKLFLWDKRTLYLGPLIEPITLSQGASTLLVSLEGEFEFLFDGLPKPLKSKSLLIPAGLNIFINTKDYVIANCNLDPLCEDYFYLSKDMSEIDRSVCWELTSLSDFQSLFKEIHEHINDSKQAFRILDKLLSKNTCSHKFKTDPRVEQTIAIIKNQVDDNISVDDLADSVGLSVPRLMQLFKQKTGVPIRRYRSWHRLYTAGLKLGEGLNMTEAALLAGFTDSAHFSNTFKDMLGMSPTQILCQPNGIRIFPPIAAATETC